MSLSQIPLSRVFRTGVQPPKIDTKINPVTSLPSPPSSIASLSTMSQPQQVNLGTKTPLMLEYERQAEERAKEQDKMREERARMAEESDRIQREADRIAEEEYEMKQYYEAEALRHAEEVRLHQEEVRRHEERVRDHDRRIRDHEASAEAFAKVIAMPSKPGRDRSISFMSPTDRKNSGGLGK
jgi:hypothetical protein